MSSDLNQKKSKIFFPKFFVAFLFLLVYTISLFDVIPHDSSKGNDRSYLTDGALHRPQIL